MTRDTAAARAEHFATLAAELFYEAENAKRARLYSDAAELTARAARASRSAHDFTMHARRAA